MEERGRVRAVVWIVAVTLMLVQLAWTNLTGLGIGDGPLTYDDVALVRLAFALAGVVAAWLVLAIGFGRGSSAAWVDVSWAVVAALAGWAVISALASDQGLVVWLGQSERLEGVGTIVLYAAVFGLGLQMGRRTGELRLLARAIALGSALLALYGLVQAVGLDPTDHSAFGLGFNARHAFASLANPNFLGAHLVLALPVCAALAMSAKGAAERILMWVATGAVFAAVLATVSQGAWVGVAVQAAVAVAWWWRSRTSARGESTRGVSHVRGPALIAAGTLVVVVALIVAAEFTGLNLGRSLSDSGSARIGLARTGLDAALERPLTGYGPDTYLAAFRMHHPGDYLDEFGMQAASNNAHSWIPQYLATLGFPGALLLLGALAIGLWRGRPPTWPERGDGDAVLTAGLWLAALGFAVQSAFSVSMIASTIPFWLLLGAICSQRAREARVAPSAGWALAAALAVVLAGSAVYSVRFITADAIYLDSRDVFHGDAEGDAIALAARAVELNPLSVKYARGLAQAKSVVAYDAASDPTASDEVVRAIYDEVAADYGAVLEDSPNDYASLAWLSALQAVAGSRLEDPALLEASAATATRAAALDRTHWEVAGLAAGEVTRESIDAANSTRAAP